MDLTDIHRISYPTTTEYILFSSTLRTFSKLDYMLGRKTSLNKFKKFEIISHIFTQQNEVKLEINSKKKTKKITNMWIKQDMLEQQLGQEEIQKESKKYIKTNKNECTMNAHHNETYGIQ